MLEETLLVVGDKQQNRSLLFAVRGAGTPLGVSLACPLDRFVRLIDAASDGGQCAGRPVELALDVSSLNMGWETRRWVRSAWAWEEASL